MSKRAALALGAALVLLIGCEKSQTPVELSGTVTYKGEPLKGGTISFYTDNHGIINTPITHDGTYSVKLPVDSLRVSIETESFNPDRTTPVYGAATAGGMKGRPPTAGAKAPPGGENKMKAERMRAEGKGSGGEGGSTGFGPPPKEELAKLYTKIPGKYALKETSGFAFQLEAGKHTKNFELTD